MRKFIFAIFLVVLTGVLLAGCSKNPMGSYGPAWDVGIKVPMMSNQTTTITEMLGEETDLDLSGDTIRYNKQENLDSINIGEYITDIEMPTDFSNLGITLPEITLSGLITENVSFAISGGADGSSTFNQFTNIDLTTYFNRVTFSDNGNKMNITITAPTNVTIDSVTIELSSNGTSLGTVDFGTILGGYDSTGIIYLNNDEIVNSIDVSISNLTTSGSGTDEIMNIDFSIPSAEIVYIDGYDLPETNISNSFNISFPTPTTGIDDVQSVTFEGGSFDLNIVPPSERNLIFDVQSISIGGLVFNNPTNNSNSYSLPLTDQSINISNNNLVVNFDLTVSGSDIIYDVDDSISTTGSSFSNVVVKSITAVINELFLNDLDSSYSIPAFNLELPEETDDFQFNDLIVDLVVTNNTGDPDSNGLPADISSLGFIAKSGSTILDNFVLYDVDPDSSTITRGENRISLINSNAETDLLDLVYAKPDSIEFDVSGIKFGNGSSVVISSDSTFDLAMDFDMGFDFNLTEDLIYKTEPSSIDTLSDEDIEMIKKGASTFKVVSYINNQLQVKAYLNFYLGSIPNGDSMEATELENALYIPENRIPSSMNEGEYTLELDPKQLNEIELAVDPQEAERFTEDNLYVGMELILPAGNIKFTPDDYIKVDQVYSVLTVKVNN